MKLKTSELTGVALDWAVAKCNGKTLHYFVDDPFKKDPWLTVDGNADQPLHSYTPSTDWAQGGPIIERAGVAIDCVQSDGEIAGWIAQLPMFREAKYEEPSPTPLIAAMRCYAASKLGDEVDVPEELQ